MLGISTQTRSKPKDREILSKWAGAVSAEQKVTYGTYLGVDRVRNRRHPKAGDILIKYHPTARRVSAPSAPKSSRSSWAAVRTPQNHWMREPWRPFSSREDFEFAELVHDAALTRAQTETLIALIQRCQNSPGPFTLRGYKDLKEAWDNASKLLTRASIPSIFSTPNRFPLILS